MVVVNILVVVGLVLIVLVGLNFNILRSLFSVKKLTSSDDEHCDGPVYYMRAYGGYYLEDFVKEGGVKTEEDMLSFISRKLTYGILRMNNYGRIASCSTFLTRAEDGHVVFGRNYDYWKTGTLIVHTKPGKGRYESYSTLDLEFLGIIKGEDVKGLLDYLILLASPYAPVDGMNEKGLAIACLMSFQAEPEWGIPTNQDTGKPSMNTTTFIRLALDYCSTVDEVIALASSYDMHDTGKMSCHYQVADASGKSAVIEWVAGNNETDTDGSIRKMNVIYNNDDSLHCTNFVLSDGYYEGMDDSVKQGLGRYNIIRDELKKNNDKVKDNVHAMEILQNVGCRGLDFEEHDNTIWSVVYDLTNRKARWITNEHYGDKKYEITKKLKKHKKNGE